MYTYLIMETINMPLPKLPTIEYELKLPSTGKKIKFRPFQTREQKILMLAREENNKKSFLNAMKNIASGCVLSKDVDINSLTDVDLQYLFLNIRAKSVGEIIEARVICDGDSCSEKISVEFDLSKIMVEQPKKKPDNTILLGGNIGITLKPLTMKLAEELGENATIDEAVSVDALKYLIENVYDSDNVYPFSDTSDEEIDAFLETLSMGHLEKIDDYYKTKPKLVYNIAVKCPKCSKVTHLDFERMSDFLS